MKFTVILSLLLLFTSVLEASYARSIREGTYRTKAEANKALEELNNFIASNDRLIDIQDNQGFTTSVIKSGKYYMHNLQPFTNKKLVQETLDILRTQYSYVYPRKIKFKASYLHPKKEERYVEKKIEPAPKPREDMTLHNTSVNRDAVIDKIGTVLADKGISSKSATKTIKRDTKEGYPSLNLKLPILKYTYLAKDDNKQSKHNLQDSESVPMSLFKNNTFELLAFGMFIILTLLIMIFLRYRASKKNRITIQDIYN